MNTEDIIISSQLSKYIYDILPNNFNENVKPKNYILNKVNNSLKLTFKSKPPKFDDVKIIKTNMNSIVDRYIYLLTITQLYSKRRDLMEPVSGIVMFKRKGTKKWYVVFKGTKNKSEAIMDLIFRNPLDNVKFKGKDDNGNIIAFDKIHWGLYTVWENAFLNSPISNHNVMTFLKTQVQQGYEVIFSGHSMGAWLACFSSIYWLNENRMENYTIKALEDKIKTIAFSVPAIQTQLFGPKRQKNMTLCEYSSKILQSNQIHFAIDKDIVCNDSTIACRKKPSSECATILFKTKQRSNSYQYGSLTKQQTVGLKNTGKVDQNSFLNIVTPKIKLSNIIKYEIKLHSMNLYLLCVLNTFGILSYDFITRLFDSNNITQHSYLFDTFTTSTNMKEDMETFAVINKQLPFNLDKNVRESLDVMLGNKIRNPMLMRNINIRNHIKKYDNSTNLQNIIRMVELLQFKATGKKNGWYFYSKSSFKNDSAKNNSTNDNDLKNDATSKST